MSVFDTLRFFRSFAAKNQRALGREAPFDPLPPCPHHPSCHCTLDPIDAAVVRVCATAYSYYSKYDPYLFNSDGKHPHGKEKLFHLWGYTVADAPWLQKELNGRQERSIFLAIINWEH